MRAGLFVAFALAATLAYANTVPGQYKPQHAYLYSFDSQVSSNLVGSTNAEVQQHSATRLRSQIRVVFTSDRHVQLQFENVRIGESNGQNLDQQRMQPFELFKRQQLSDDVQKKLELPFEIEYVDGVVERITFHEKDSAWSKNIKRSVLNQLQANLQQSNVQGLKMEQQPQDKNAQLFTLPEITLEGECQVTYTIQTPSDKNELKQGNYLFNVTKSIDFQRCQQTPSVHYGYRAQAAHEQQCHQCLLNQKYESVERLDALKLNQCQQECLSNSVNTAQDIERTTVQRFELRGDADKKFTVRQSQTVSQYLVKAYNPSTQDAVAQVVSITELRFRKEESGAKKITVSPSNLEETLMFSSEWDFAEKRFYMYGDEEFSQQTKQPFAEVKNKNTKIMNNLRYIQKQWENKELGYELDTAQRFNELIQYVRQSSVEELKKMEEEINQVESKEAREHVKAIFIDALAVAGTRNGLYCLVEKIQKKQLSEPRAIHALKTFSMNQHSPSDRQTDLLEKLAKQLDQEDVNPVLKQTAWLKFSASVGMICQNRPSETTKTSFRVEELCPLTKKEQYKQTLVQKLKKANSLYEKILAIKAIGNAALENTVSELEKHIYDNRQPTIVRIESIDALRRLRTLLSKNIQRVLLPLFLNQKEQPEIRMAAFSMIVHTRPQQALLDQITLPMIMERSQQVKSFVILTMEALAASPIEAERQLARHLQATLKLVKNTGLHQVSGAIHVPVYVSQPGDEEEQNVFIRLASMVSPTNVLPIHLCASIRAALNGQSTEEKLSLQFTQKNLEQLYEKFVMFTHEKEESAKTEGKYAKQLNAIYTTLGIKSRRSGSYFVSGEADEQQNDETPFAMFFIRTNEVDQWVLPIDEKSLPSTIQQILNGEQSIVSQYSNFLDQLREKKSFQSHTSTTFSEKKTKLATSAGMPLAVMWDITAVGSTEGHLHAKPEEQSIRLQARTSGIISHNLRTEVWTPVTATGVESIRILEITLPVDVELKHEKSNDYAAMLRLPTKSASQRILGFHTLPFTYTRKFDSDEKVYKQMQIKSVQNFALSPMQREFRASQQHGQTIRVDGHVHFVKSNEQLLKALYTAENNVHVYFKPQPNTPEHVIFRAQGSSFERIEGMSADEMKQFYTEKNGAGFDSYETEEEFTNLSLENDEKRGQKLDKYLSKFSPKHAYKHQLQLSAEAKCGAKTHTVSTTLGAQCDSQMKYCKVQVNAERTPLSYESSNWSLKSTSQILMPEIVRSDEIPQDKHSRMLFQINSEWGNAPSELQRVQLRLQGEPTKKTSWQQQSEENAEDTENQQGKPWSRNLNKYDLIAEYKLNHQNEQAAKRLYDLVKARFYWQLNQQSTKNTERQIRATFVVDPLTRRHANLTIRTPNEKIRLDSVVLPFRMAGYELNRRTVNIHSFQHIAEKLSNKNSAECRANERRISTFDGVSYNAPMGDCWSVLAKDCSSNTPRFVVLMKKSQNERIVKIQTPERVIELIAENDKPTMVKVEGEQIVDEEQLREIGIAHLSEEDVHVSVRSINIRFDGEEAQVKISSLYKNLQCGLCGHYNGEEDEDVFRSSNNRQAESVKDFVQSYVLKSKDCNVKSYNNIDSDQFKIARNQRQQDDFYRSEESQESSSESDSKESTEEESSKPEQRTVHQETRHKLCFSMKPVAQCPRGYFANQTKTQQVQFACLDRSDSTARQMMRQLKGGQKTLKMIGLKKSMTQEIEVPTLCA